MKHIKTYEGIIEDSKYNVGDYVILKNQTTYDFELYKNYGIIINKIIGQSDRNETYMYDVNYLDKNDYQIKNLSTHYVLEKFILRKMTKEEIGEFQLLENTGKYNL